MDRSFSSFIQQKSREGAITVDFADIRSLQILTDKLKRLLHLLRLNISLIEQLNAFFIRVKVCLPPDEDGISLPYEAMMQNYGFQIHTHIARLESLTDRAKGVGSLVSIVVEAVELCLLIYAV